MGNPKLTDIQKLLSRPDPHLSFKWVCYDDTLPFGLPSTYLEGIEVPFLNIKVQQGVFSGSGYNYFPGFHDISAFNMTLYEDQMASTLKWIYAWKKRIKDFNTGAYELPINYKRDMKVCLLNTLNDIILKIHLMNIWPADTQSLNLGYTDDGRTIISQTFSIDSHDLLD